MKEDLTEIYRAPTVSDAQRLADRLSHAGIESFVNDVEEPMHGLPAGPRGRTVSVRTAATSQAREIVEAHERDPQDEVPASG